MAFCTCRRLSAWSKTTERSRIDHRVGDLLAAMRGQAVHEDGVRRRIRPRVRRSPDRAGKSERVPAPRLRDPCWSRRRYRPRRAPATASCGSVRISTHRSRLLRDLLGIGQNLRIGTIARGRGDAYVRTEHAPRSAATNGTRCCRRRHRPGRFSCRSPKRLVQSEVVGQRLAGMLQIAQRIDHGDARRARAMPSTVLWAKVRSTMASTQRSRLCAMSLSFSRASSRPEVWSTNMA